MSHYEPHRTLVIVTTHAARADAWRTLRAQIDQDAAEWARIGRVVDLTVYVDGAGTEPGRGRAGYWRTYDEAFALVRSERRDDDLDLVVFLQDDVELCASFLSRVWLTLSRTPAPSVVSLHRDARPLGGGFWGASVGVDDPATGLTVMTWIDCVAWAARASAPVFEARFAHWPMRTTSGVPAQLTRACHAAGSPIYRVPASLVRHRADLPSLMCPGEESEVRRLAAMTVDFIDDL